MARVETIIVGGGISAGSPFTLGAFPYIANTDPPIVIASPLLKQATGAIVVAAVDPQPLAAEVLRVKGGLISEGVGVDSVVVGRGASAPVAGIEAIAIGRLAITRQNRQIAIGYSADAGGNSASIAIGNGATINPTSAGGINIGGLLGIVAASSVVIAGSIADGGGGIVIGGSTNASGVEAVVIGRGSTGNAFGVVVLGDQAFVNATSGIAIGSRSGGAVTRVTAAGGIAIGQAVDVSGANGIAIGTQAVITHASAIVLGAGAASAAIGSCVIGGAAGPISTVIIGSGDTVAAPGAVTIRVTDGVGANIGAGALSVRSGISTGNGASPPLNFVVGSAVAGASSVAQTPYTALQLADSVADIRTIFYTPAGSTKSLFLEFRTNGSSRALIGAAGTANGIVTGAVAGETVIRTANQRLLFSLNNGTGIQAEFSALGVFTENVDRGVRFNNQTSSAGALAGTLLNAPTAGNPGFWLKINIGGVNYSIPCWAG